MNTHMKLKIMLSGGARLAFSLVLAAGLLFTSGQAIAADALEKTKIFLWLSAIPSWMPSVFLIATLTGLSWLGFALIRRWLPAAGQGKRNNRMGYYAIIAGALVGILLAPLITNLWKGYLSESINFLPPSAAGNVVVALSWNPSTAANVGGYKVYYGTSSGVYTASVDAGNNTNYQVLGLQQGVTYYLAVKAYDLTKTVEGGPSAEITATATAPVVDFTASQTSGNAPMTVSFTPAVTEPVTSWQWNFGDGTTNAGTSSTVPNAIKSYGSPGTYSVSLTVTVSGGNITQTYANLITASPPPPSAVAFTASPTSGNAPLVTELIPTVTGGTITSWQWSFGDGNTSSGTGSSVPSAFWSYANAGSYTVSLTVTGPGGSVTQTNPNYITVATTSSTDGTGSSGSTINVNSNGLVAAYSFDNIFGSVALDYSGNSHYATISNAVKMNQGRFGTALNFNGTNAWVTVGNNTSLALNTGMTLEAWVYPTATMSGLDTVVMKEQPATATSAGTATYLLAANSSANLPMSAFWNGSEATANGNTQIPPNQWTHLASTYNGQYQNLYVNGVLVETLPQTGPIATSTGALRIGGNSIWGGYFQGYIDEVRIYNKALSNAQIISDSNTPISVSNPPQFIVGDPKVESTPTSLPAGVAQAFQFIAPTSSKFGTAIPVYVDAGSTATGLNVAVYTDASGHPGKINLMKGTLATLQPGAWNLVTIPYPAQFTAGTPYWIGILGKGGTLNLRGQLGTGTGLMETSASSTLTALPNAWSTGGTSTYGAVSAYIAGY